MGIWRKAVLMICAVACMVAQPTRLEPGRTLKCELGGGQSQEFELSLQAGQYAEILLDQRSINVAVECIGPDGKRRFSADSRFIGDIETVELIADASGPFRLRVTAPDEHAPVGHYDITLREIETATERDRSRIAAARAYAQGAAYIKAPSSEEILKAVGHLEHAVGQWRAAYDRIEESRTLGMIGLFYTEYGDRQKALDYTNQAIATAQTSHDQRTEAWALEYAATVWNSFGDKRKAIEYADRALAMMRTVNDRAGEADALNNLGRAHYLTGEARKSIDSFKGAMSIYGEIQDRESISTVAGNLGVIYSSLGESRTALDYHQQSLLLSRETGKLGGEAITLSNIGSCYQDLGEYQTALDSYFAALEINRRLDRRPHMASNFHNIASAYDSLGDRQRALDFDQQALAIFRASGDQWSVGNTTNNIGTIYAELGDYANAIKFYNHALSFRRAVGNRVGEAVTLNNIGRVYSKLGTRDKALDYFGQALAIHRTTGEQLLMTPTLRNLGTFYRESRNYERALLFLNEALEISRTINDRNGEAFALAILARLECDRGDFQKAHERAEESLGVYEAVRGSVQSPSLRASFFTSARDALEVEIEALVGLHAEAAALVASERGRARSLVEMLAEGRVEIRSGVDAALVVRERDLQQLISAKADRQSRLLARAHTDEDARSAAKELDALTTELEQVQSRIRENSPAYASLTQPAPLDLREIQTQVLDKETVLLEYSLGVRKSFLWVVSPSSVELFRLPPRSEIESVAKGVYESGRRKVLAPVQAAKASAVLLGPAAGRIANKRLLIVGEGVLQYLPFAALPEPGSAGTAVPLILNHEIVNAPSASVVAVLRREARVRKPARKTLAILADPVFSANDARFATSVAHRSTGDLNAEEFVRLRFSRTEADVIARLAPAAATFEALDFDASRDTVLNSDLGDYRILHFATHSVLNNEHPELSGIVLSLVDHAGRPQNGFLRLFDIYNLRLGADLVVLSACQTALGGEVTGEGLIGLTRGFLYAGAPRILATLWEIDDRTTAELMKHFYEGVLGHGERPAAALRSAQIAMFRTKGWNAPYYWAAFTIQGEWR